MMIGTSWSSDYIHSHEVMIIFSLILMITVTIVVVDETIIIVIIIIIIIITVSAELILGLCPANERCRYKVTLPLINCVQT